MEKRLARKSLLRRMIEKNEMLFTKKSRSELLDEYSVLMNTKSAKSKKRRRKNKARRRMR